MNKVPVGRTIGQVYRFSFNGYFAVLGIVWLPLLLMMAAGYFLFLPVAHDLAGIKRYMTLHPGDPSAVFPAMNGFISRVYGFDFLTLLFAVWIQVGITKEILGLRKGPRFVYLPSGADEGRVLLTYIVLIILAYLAIIAVVIAAVLIGLACYAIFASGVAKGFDPHALGGFIAVPLVLIDFAILYVFVRVLYFVGPATVAERQMILNRSWQLTRGNFWRIFVILLATLLPIYVAEIVLVGASVLPFIHQLATMPGNADPAAVFTALWTDIARLLPYYAAVGFLVAPFFYGLFIASSAFAYRALVPAKPPEN